MNNQRIQIVAHINRDEDVKAFTEAKNLSKGKIIKVYHSGDLQQKAGVSENQIKRWTMTGIINPYKPVKGTGRMHVYDHQNLIEAMICRDLSQYSMTSYVMGGVLEFLRSTKWTFNIKFSLDLSRFVESFLEIKKWENKVPNETTKKILENQEVIADKIRTEHKFTDLEMKDNIWEYLKLYPQTKTEPLFLALWPNLAPEKIQEQDKDDFYCWVVNEDDLSKIIHSKSSVIIINLTRLASRAGSFFEEA